MARRREPELLDDAFRLFVMAPVWVGPVVAGIMFGFFWMIPIVWPDKGPMTFGDGLWHMLAWVVGGMLMVAWGAALVVKVFRRR